jgi:glycosyltransferase involved in cell wall biosynthesis
MKIQRKATVFLFALIFFANILAAENKICLTMIVKNEGKIIERCLDSMKEIIDYVSICDTGSTDDTVEVIENYLQRTGIPGAVHHHTWENFGHNRTLSVQSAQKFLKEEEASLAETFLLLLDADMMLEISADFDKDELTADHYLMRQTNHSFIYYNTRLIRASLPWVCVGATHEYWSCKVPCKEEKLEKLAIDDRNDGGSKADKFERDVKLLTKELEQQPWNTRSMFYLATSYHCLEQFDEALKWYETYIKHGGWYEEVWYSKYMIGTIYEELDQWELALAYYLDAYQTNPGRAEPLQRISKYYRMNEQYELAYFFAKQGAEIPFPYNQTLFISFPVYDYLFDEDLSICAYYTPHKDEGFAAVDRLMLKKSVPYYIKNQAIHNALFYIKPLPNARYQPIVIDLPPIREGMGVHYNPMNPSIKKTNEGYDVILRTVNYMTIGAKHFQTLDILDPTNTIKTRNFFLQYDKEFNLLSQQEIIEDLHRPHFKYRNIEGLEDCRLFEFEGSDWFTCTTLDTNPSGQPQVSLCKLSDDRSQSTIQVEKLMPIVGPDLNRCEKNWLPFVKDDVFSIIYSYDPFIIYQPKIENSFPRADTKTEAIRQNSVLDFSRFSGSTPPIPFDGGYLFLVHETLYEDGRIYLQRFVFLDQDLNITKLSKPFLFLHQGIEYSCGMAIDHEEENLVITVGVEDRDAYFCTVDLKTVRGLLETLD